MLCELCYDVLLQGPDVCCSLERNKPEPEVRESIVLHFSKRESKAQQADGRSETAKSFMTTLSFLFHGPFMNEVSPFHSRSCDEAERRRAPKEVEGR